MVERHIPVLNTKALQVPVSYGNSLIFKTGSLRSEKPVFVNKVAPCRHACPIGIDIPTAFHMASKGDLDQALSIYLQENPLPGICGRVCYHPCETECNRGQFDEPVNIRSFERFLSDHGRVDIKKDVGIYSKKERIAVIGSGPGGLSAAYHLARLGYHITLFEARRELGGMLRYGIPSYRLPRSIIDREIERILSLGIEVRLQTTIGQDIGWKELESFDAIFVSIGLQLGKIPFEIDGSGNSILTGLDFLADPPKWPLGKGSPKTLIIGGGNVAIDVARTLLRLCRGKSNNITIICPESRGQMPALREEIDEALEEGITILNGWAPFRIYEEKGKVLSLDFSQAEVRRDEISGTVEIILKEGEVKNYKAKKVFMAIGQTTKSFNLDQYIEMKQDRIITDLFGKTCLPKVFAGGDAIGEKVFVADAIASGKRGAFAISCFLEGREVKKEFEAHQIGNSLTFTSQYLKNSVDLKKVVSFDELNTLFFYHQPRNHPNKLEPERRVKAFDEVSEGLGADQMKEEISRCFGCGTCIDCENCFDFCPDVSILKDSKLGWYSFDSDYCKGCGVCFVACPRSIIEMVRETK
jgi:NADPH-dependent glutamate synthase beta subunit-like oxidoreductase